MSVLGMPELDLETFCNENIYPNLLQETINKNQEKQEKKYSVYESFEQINEYYTGKSPLEAGIKYLMECEFPGFYDHFYDLYNKNPNMNLSTFIQKLKKEIISNVEKI